MIPRLRSIAALQVAVVLIIAETGCPPQTRTTRYGNEVTMLDKSGKKYVGQPLSHFLEENEIQFKDLLLMDEPPGKLQHVCFRRLNQSPPDYVILWLRYSPDLMRFDRRWPEDNVKKAIVVAITIEKADRE